MTLRLPLWLAAVILFGATRSAVADDDLANFLRDRASYAKALTEPIAVCVGREDTQHPAFNGCIDWHSSVHGVWALTAYRGATGDKRFDKLIREQLDAKSLAQELRDLREHPMFEMPYGRAWFLRLAVDYKRVFGDDRLQPLAHEISRSLVEQYTQADPDPLSTAYSSATWALINLYEYGVATHDAKITTFVTAKVREQYLQGGACPLQRVEVETREFMAICTNWAWLVSKVLPRNEFKVWLDTFLPEDLAIEPIRSAGSVHQAGLNFSRTWGLWNIYRASGEERFLRAYLAHFKATYDLPDVWNGDYQRFSHWVAQFGMLGLMVTYNNPPQR